ncbi:MAG: ribonuclease HI [Gemmatimonadetes bacterium]|nr:ribonuclease HI [Gemmatimonadota bacterium]
MNPLVWIYADESCLGVQFTDRDSPGGAAGLIEHWKDGRWLRRDYCVCEPATTNNRMALQSASEGLRLLKTPCRVIFTSDSEYLIKGMREWVPAWIRRGWKRKGGPVENTELWQELVATTRRHQVDWRWIRGHAGHPQNEYANWLAVRAAKKQSRSDGLRDSGFEKWLEKQREQERYVDFYEFAPPPAQDFQATAPLP